MSTNIDERVVKMEFDDSGFSAGAEKAIGILDKLKDALNLNGASAGLNEVQNAANKFNMDSISSSVEEAGGKFNWLGGIVQGFVLSAGRSLETFAESKIKGLFNNATKGMADGFAEYQMQMGSVQTILSNTRDAFNEAGVTDEAEQIGIINDRLNELNKYADDTIYNFTQMTRNIGLFTAAGVDLDTSVVAIKGLSNLAAVSGADANAASRAMYQMSQAMSTGVVKLMDWNSLVNAGMGGKLFQDELKRVANNHGIAVDQIIAKQGSFRESLSEGWLTADIFNEALQHLTYNYEKVGDEAWKAGYAELTSAGYSDEAARSILELGKNATEAATKVRTWSQLWDTVGEAIGSGWTQTWQTIVGDFLEATELFTWFSEKISDLVSKSADARNGVLEAWAEAGGRGALVDTLKNLFEMVEKPLMAIARAFSNVFGISSEQLYNITTALAVFTKSLVMSDSAAAMFEYVLTDVFTVIHSILGVIGNLVRVLVGIGEVVWTVISPAFEGIALAFALIVDPIAKASDFILRITDVLQHFAQKGLDFIIAKIQKAYGVVDKYLLGLYKILSPYLNLFRDFGNRLGDIFDRIYRGFMEDKSADYWQRTLTFAARSMDFFLYKVGETVPVLKPFIAVLTTVAGTFLYVGKTIAGQFTKVLGLIRNALEPVFTTFAQLKLGLIDLLTGEMGFKAFVDYVKRIFGNLGREIYSSLPAPIKFAVDFLRDSFNQIKDAVLDFVSKSELIQGAIANFKSFKETIGGMMGGDISLGDGFSSMLETLKNGAIDVFWKLPKPLQLVAGGIGLLAKTIYTNAKNFVTGTSLFKNLKKVFEDFASGKETLTFLNVLTRVKGAIKDSFSSIVKTMQESPIGQLFSRLVDKIKEFGSGLVQSVPSIAAFKDSITQIFGSDDVFGAMSEKFQEMLGNLPETFKSLFEMIAQTFGYFKDNITEEAGKLDIGNIRETFSGLASLPDVLSPVADGVASVSTDTSAAMDGFLNIFAPEKFENLGGIVKGILDVGLVASLTGWIQSMKKVNNSVADVAKGIANWPKDMGNMFARIGEGFKKETKMDQLLKLASSIAILAGSLFLIASIPAGDLERAGKTIAIITGTMIGIIALMDAVSKKFTGMFDASRMAALGESMKGMGIGVLAFAAACWVIAQLDQSEFDAAIGKITAISIILAALSAAIGQNGKSVKKGAVGMILMAGAVYAMGKAIEAIGGMDQDALDNGVTYFVAIMAMLTLFGKFGGEGIGKLLGSFLKFGIGLIAFGFGLGVVAKAMEVLDESISKIENLPVVLGIMAGAIVGFTIMAKVLDRSNPLRTAVSLVVFASALIVMSIAFSVLGTFGGNWQTMLISMGALAALIGEFVGITFLAKRLDEGALMKTATALVVFGAAIAVMAAGIGAMMWLVTTDMQGFGDAIFAIAGFFAAFAAMGKFLDPAAVLTISQSLVIFGASIIVFAAGIYALQNVDVMAAVPGLIAFGVAMVALGLAAAILGPTTVFMIAAAKAMLIFGAAVLVFAAGIWILVQAIKDLEDLNPSTIVTRLAALGSGIGEMAWNMISVFFGRLIDSILLNLPGMIAAVSTLVHSIADWIRDNWDVIVEAVGTFFNTLGEIFGRIGSWIAENIGPLFANIATWVTENWPTIVAAVSGMIDTIGAALGPLAEQAWNAAQEWIGNMAAYLGSPEGQQEIFAKAKQIGKMLLDGLGMVASGIGAVVGKIKDAFVNWIKSKFKDIKTKGKNVGGDLLDGIKNGITSAPAKIRQAITDLGNTIMNKVKDFFGIHSPSTKMAEMGNHIVEGLINGIKDMFGNLGDMVGQLGEHIMEGVQNLPGTLLDLGKGAVGAVGSGLQWGAKAVGSVASGVGGAVTKGIGWLGDSLLQTGKDSGTKFNKGLGSKAGDAKNAGKSLGSNASSGSGGYEQEFYKKALAQSAKFIDGIAAKFKDAYSQGSKNAGNAASGAGSKTKDFEKSGKNSGEGLISGLKSKEKALYNKGADLAKQVNKGYNRTLQIKSPSRVMMKAAGYTIAGLVKGFNQNENKVFNSARNIGLGVVDSFSDSLTYMSVSLDDILDTDYNPVITPVINSAEFDSSMDRLASMMNSTIADTISMGDMSYNQAFGGKLDSIADSNRETMAALADSSIDYDQLGVAVANALISSGVHVEMEGGELMGYLAGKISDARRMYG